ncbi:MAG TPA: oligopeptide/dipeptide ABC transporter ATP-binding protein, partial [Thermodesulfobacteriota bacterium]|nr:oligopeptide/dipeptide ABC transporter ATP-binding protein [Thermodesulfobacteriota bacterium]
NMGIVAEMAQAVMIMYAGRVMEQAGTEDLFETPLHPYTASLLKAIPRLDQKERDRRLHVIPGIVPSLFSLPQGCKYHDRCGESLPLCAREEPGLFTVAPGRTCRCWLYSSRGIGESTSS